MIKSAEVNFKGDSSFVLATAFGTMVRICLFTVFLGWQTLQILLKTTVIPDSNWLFSGKKNQLTWTSKSGAKSRPLYWLAISLGVNDVVAITTSKSFTLIISSSRKLRSASHQRNFGDFFRIFLFFLLAKKKVVFLFFWCSLPLQANGGSWLARRRCDFFSVFANFSRFFTFSAFW